MIDPLSATSALVGPVAFSYQASKALRDAIQSYHQHPKYVEDLKDELSALEDILLLLKQSLLTSSESDYALLELPVLRCGHACEEFQQALQRCSTQDRDDRSSFRDWLKIRWMGNDIHGFKDTLAGYKATIAIAIASANLRTSKTSLDIILEYQEMTRFTKTNLQNHLCDIDEKLRGIGHEMYLSGDPVDKNIIVTERESTIRSLEICGQVADFIEEHHRRMAESLSDSKYLDGQTSTGKESSSARQILDDSLSEFRLRWKRLLELQPNEQIHGYQLPLRDYAQQRFDDSASVASAESDFSTASTLDGTVITDDLIQRCVKLLFCCGNLNLFYKAASYDPAIGLESMRRELRGLITNFGKELSLEATNKDEHGASRLLRSRTLSSRAAMVAVEQALESESRNPRDSVAKETHSDDNDLVRGEIAHSEEKMDHAPEEEDEYSDADDLADDAATLVEDSFLSLTTFLLYSETYSKFRLRLLELIIAPHENRIREALGPDLISDRNRTLDCQAARDVVAELSFVPFDHFIILSHVDLGILDRIQAGIEDIMKESWQWWPLPPRRHTLLPGYKRLCWTSVSPTFN